MGNHGFDQREIIPYLQKEPRLVRANNYPLGTPGNTAYVIELKDGRKCAVLHTMGRLYMDALDDPFAATANDLKKFSLGANVQAIVVDIHAEATSEKMAFAHHFDGKVSVVVGTHTHVPTSDARVLKGGTAYQTDLGMCGDYDSVIGFDKAVPIERFLRKMPTERLDPAKGEGLMSGLIIETNDKSGLALSVKRLSPFNN
jgi:metallophosphoesterase (TIGR00282 family)